MGRPHEVLEVPRDADERTVKAAYRELMKEHHPDHGGSTERFLEIKEAYEAMLDDGSVTAALRSGSSTVTATRSPSATQRPAKGSTGQTVEGEKGLELEARADGLVVRLTALTDRLPTGAMLPDHVDAGRRMGATFHVHNETNQPVTWQARKVRFVGSEGDRYLPTVYRPKRRRLPKEWRGDDVELDPGESVRSFLLSRELPEDVAVESVVYDQGSSPGSDRKMVFELDGRERQALDRPPFQ